MSNEIQLELPPGGDTLDVYISRMTDGFYYKPSTHTFVAPANTPSLFNIVLPESAYPGVYQMDFPTQITTPGLYWVTARLRAAGALGNPATSDDVKGKWLANWDGTQIIPMPSAAQVLAAFKADTDWQTMVANVNGVFTFNEATGVLTLKDKTGTTTLATLTLTRSNSGTVTARASA